MTECNWCYYTQLDVALRTGSQPFDGACLGLRGTSDVYAELIVDVELILSAISTMSRFLLRLSLRGKEQRKVGESADSNRTTHGIANPNETDSGCGSGFQVGWGVAHIQGVARRQPKVP